jgi:hypothetical protein
MSDEPSLTRFSENTMRPLFELALTAVAISVAPAAIAQNNTGMGAMEGMHGNKSGSMGKMEME